MRKPNHELNTLLETTVLRMRTLRTHVVNQSIRNSPSPIINEAFLDIYRLGQASAGVAVDWILNKRQPQLHHLAEILDELETRYRTPPMTRWGHNVLSAWLPILNQTSQVSPLKPLEKLFKENALPDDLLQQVGNTPCLFYSPLSSDYLISMMAEEIARRGGITQFSVKPVVLDVTDSARVVFPPIDETNPYHGFVSVLVDIHPYRLTRPAIMKSLAGLTQNHLIY